jgi:PKD repeat protein
MKTTITKKLLGLALSVFSIAAMAQCPTITNLTTTTGANGTATVTPVITGTINPLFGSLYWSAYPSATQTSGNGTFQFPANGTYSVCLNYMDSLNSCWSSLCTSVTISNMSASSCNAGFYFYTDSSCVTNFINTSTGSNLSYNWYINGVSYGSTNPSVSLANGSYNALLFTYSGGSLCDSTSQNISISCGGSGTNTPCQASFYTYTDSSCVTHFVNTSLGGGNSFWYINGMTYSASPSPAVALANGSYYATLYSYTPAGGFCDSITQMITVSCGSGTTTAGCQANSQFYIFADSLNAGNYFAYNLSWTSGAASYLWDFGDGTTSSQQYPFHQYAIPGQYIVCLTVTSTSGTTTCADTYCDSSSVQRMAAGFQMSQVNVIPLSVTGIKQIEKEIGLIAFPNPIADELTIEATTTNDNKLTFVLVDALGRIVLTGNLNNSKTTINTSNLEKGFYSLSVTNEKGSSLKTIKLVK